MIKVADVCNQVKPRQICMEWTRRISEEYSCQVKFLLSKTILAFQFLYIVIGFFFILNKVIKGTIFSLLLNYNIMKICCKQNSCLVNKLIS